MAPQLGSASFQYTLAPSYLYSAHHSACIFYSQFVHLLHLTCSSLEAGAVSYQSPSLYVGDTLWVLGMWILPPPPTHRCWFVFQLHHLPGMNKICEDHKSSSSIEFCKWDNRGEAWYLEHRRICMTWLYSWNQHNLVNQLSSDIE